MPKRKAKKDLCKKQISFRCTEKEDRWIKDLAAQEKMQQKELIMNGLRMTYGKQGQRTKKGIDQATCACEVQRLVNHLKRDHQNDPYIEEVCKKIWNIVS